MKTDVGERHKEYAMYVLHSYGEGTPLVIRGKAN